MLLTDLMQKEKKESQDTLDQLAEILAAMKKLLVELSADKGDLNNILSTLSEFNVDNKKVNTTNQSSLDSLSGTFASILTYMQLVYHLYSGAPKKSEMDDLDIDPKNKAKASSEETLSNQIVQLEIILQALEKGQLNDRPKS